MTEFKPGIRTSDPELAQLLEEFGMPDCYVSPDYYDPTIITVTGTTVEEIAESLMQQGIPGYIFQWLNVTISTDGEASLH